jgi:hypothetical protein
MKQKALRFSSIFCIFSSLVISLNFDILNK